MRADRIVVLDQGRVAEEGTHEFLISRKGKYFSLWQRQLPRESEDGPEREDEARWKSPSGMREDGPR
jgi:ABC-type glutathione transport system ATPase component